MARPSSTTVGDICRLGRRNTLGKLVVCIDGVEARDPVAELDALHIENVALVEFFGEVFRLGTSSGATLALGGGFGRGAPGARLPVTGQVRIYTHQWIASRAGGQMFALLSMELDGC